MVNDSLEHQGMFPLSSDLTGAFVSLIRREDRYRFLGTLLWLCSRQYFREMLTFLNLESIETDDIETNDIETDDIETDDIKTDGIDTDEIEIDDISTDYTKTDDDIKMQ